MDYKIIDTHCHPQFPQYDADRDEILKETLGRGIGMVCVGTDAETSRQAIALAERYEGLYASVGLHPNETGEIPDALAEHSKVVAIGECGLDYFRTANHEIQQTNFERQLQLAQHVQKPIIIHCRDAHEDMIEVLRRYPKQRGVIHSFNGTAEQALLYIEAGFYIGLNGIMTFSNEYIPMIQSLPGERILLETDAPYLAPVSYRGKRNSPSYIETVGNYIARIRNEDSRMLFSGTVHNARELFAL